MPATKKPSTAHRKPGRSTRTARVDPGKFAQNDMASGREWDSPAPAESTEHNGVDNDLAIDLTLQDDEAVARRGRP